MFDEVKRAVQVLQKGGVILYPTDTVWGIGCNATHKDAVEKIYQIKQRSETKSMILLVDNLERLRQYVDFVPDMILELLEKAEKPTTIIYPNAKKLPSNLIAIDGSIAIRIVNHEFCKELIRQINAPLVSTSANISGEVTPRLFGDISSEILNRVDYVVNWSHHSDIELVPSTIIKIIDDQNFEVIRP
ncbi:MAG: L-threonylcarbamoyladenylate synthase [Bacteroidota bacterium]